MQFVQFVQFNHCLKRGLTQMACVGKMSPDMQVSFSPTWMQLLNPRSSPM